MTDMQKRASELKEDIEMACIRKGLNLTIYDGKIGFVDQSQKKIVMLWEPKFTIPSKL